VIDVIKGEGVGLDWYVRELERRASGTASRDRGCGATTYLPHDGAVREIGTGKSRIERLQRARHLRDDLPEPAGGGRHPGGAHDAAAMLVRPDALREGAGGAAHVPAQL
jgi:hypothetical protein